MTPFASAFALALKNARMSQSELARRVGCGRNSISAYLRGEAVPRRERLAKINDALGADLSVSRPATIQEVARGMGMSEHTLRRGMRMNCGRLSEIGVVIPSQNGKRSCFRFFPAEVRRIVGIE